MSKEPEEDEEKPHKYDSCAYPVDQEDHRGDGVSGHFRAKEAEEGSGDHRWNPYFRDYDD